MAKKNTEAQFGGGHEKKSRISLKNKLIAGALAGAAILGYVERGNIEDTFAFVGAKDYYAADWYERGAWSVSTWGKIIGESSQKNGVAVDANLGSEAIRVNVFDGGITENGENAFNFSPVHGLPYALMLTVSQGNPEYVLKNTTGGLFPLPLYDADKQPLASRLASDLGIDNYNPKDPEQNTQVFMRYFNTQVASLYQFPPEQKALATMTDPGTKEKALIRNAIKIYLTDITPPDRKAPTDGNIDTIYQLIDAQDMPDFAGLDSMLKQPSNQVIVDNLTRADQIISSKPTIYSNIIEKSKS